MGENIRENLGKGVSFNLSARLGEFISPKVGDEYVMRCLSAFVSMCVSGVEIQKGFYCFE